MPENSKALSRAARSYYQLRLFERAHHYFERLAALDPSAKSDVESCKQRLNEEGFGKFNWADLHKKKRETGEVLRLDVADYMNSEAIEIRFISKEKEMFETIR